MRRVRLATIGTAVVLALSSLSAAQAAPRTPDRGKEPALAPVHTSAAAIDGEWIVMLKPGASPRERRSVMSLVRRDRGKVTREYDTAINGFAATMSDRTVERLRRIPAVTFIEANAPIRLPEPPPASPRTTATQSPVDWGLDRIDQRDLPLDNSYTHSYDGAGVTVYVMDSGVLSNHVEFGSRVTAGWDFIDNDNAAEDCLGHGTPVAGIIGSATYGVAKAVEIVPVRTFDCYGGATWAILLDAVDWITSHHQPGTPAVANASLGGNSTILKAAIQESIASGITWVAAAGNAGVDACDRAINAWTSRGIVVAASDASDTRSVWNSSESSNWGSCVHLFAPGSGTTSTGHTSTTAITGFAGTSSASPYVAGAAALYLSKYPNATPSRVKGVLINNATTGKISDLKGSPNRLLYTGFITP